MYLEKQFKKAETALFIVFMVCYLDIIFVKKDIKKMAFREC